MDCGNLHFGLIGLWGGVQNSQNSSNYIWDVIFYIILYMWKIILIVEILVNCYLVLEQNT